MPGRPRIIDCNGKLIQVEIGPDWKLVYRDLSKNKPVASLPKSVPADIQAELKSLPAMLKLVVKGTGGSRT